MVRPTIEDRKSVTLTHVRISPNTKALLLDLQRRNNFKSIDAVIQYYLNEKAIANQANFHSAKEIYNLTKRHPDIDRLVKGASNQIMRSINKSELDQSKSKSVHNKRSWQRQREF